MAHVVAFFLRAIVALRFGARYLDCVRPTNGQQGEHMTTTEALMANATDSTNAAGHALFALIAAVVPDAVYQGANSTTLDHPHEFSIQYTQGETRILVSRRYRSSTPWAVYVSVGGVSTRNLELVTFSDVLSVVSPVGAVGSRE